MISSGIYGAGCGKSTVVKKCINDEQVCGNNAGGIYCAWSIGSALNSINAGAIMGVGTGGFSTGIENNYINKGTLIDVIVPKYLINMYNY